MSKRRGDIVPGAPLLDLASLGRRGPGGAPLTPAEVQHIARTVRRTPEVMVKVLRHGGTDQGSVQRHLDYLTRKGELPLETDDDQQFIGKGTERSLLADWDLDLEESRPQASLGARAGRAPPRLAHKLLFSMPARTPPDKVLLAVKTFCREEFGLKHRYAMVLHTDEPHPHVHVVVKAVSEQGWRLNIKKAQLRAWRAAFARQLRAQGVAANATERAVRGSSGLRKTDPIYRAMIRGASTHLSAQLSRLALQDQEENHRSVAGGNRMAVTRKQVEAGWAAVSRALEQSGELAMAEEVSAFAAQLAPVRTDQALLVERLAGSAREVTPGSTALE